MLMTELVEVEFFNIFFKSDFRDVSVNSDIQFFFFLNAQITTWRHFKMAAIAILASRKTLC